MNGKQNKKQDESLHIWLAHFLVLQPQNNDDNCTLHTTFRAGFPTLQPNPFHFEWLVSTVNDVIKHVVLCNLRSASCQVFCFLFQLARAALLLSFWDLVQCQVVFSSKTSKGGNSMTSLTQKEQKKISKTRPTCKRLVGSPSFLGKPFLLFVFIVAVSDRTKSKEDAAVWLSRCPQSAGYKTRCVEL